MKIFLEPILSASGPMATRTAALKIASVLGDALGEIPVVAAFDTKKADDADVEVLSEHRRFNRTAVANIGEQCHVLVGEIKPKLLFGCMNSIDLNRLGIVEDNWHRDISFGLR